MKSLINFTLTLIIALSASLSYADGPWVGETGEQVVSGSFVYDTFDEIWAADNEAGGPGEVDQVNLWLEYSLAITDNITIGFLTGVTSASLDRTDGLDTEDFEGRSDTSLSIKYLLVDEFASDSGLPTMAAKLSLISKGTYDRSAPPNVHAPGDKSDGVELLIKAGKLFSNGIAAFGEVGYRVRGQEVPDDILYNIGFNLALTDTFSMFSRIGTERSRTGIEIPDIVEGRYPGTDFHRLKEEKDTIELGGSVTLSKSMALSFVVANVFDGRNTGQSNIVSGTFSYYF